MDRFLVFSGLFCALLSVNGQRVAPGVPPQHYQQPQQYQHVPQQQYQQAPQQQYQQVPVQQQQQYQQQQVPVQQQQQYQQAPVQQQQHVPVQQQPQQQQHQQAAHSHHSGHGAPQQLLNAANMAHEKDHIAEHLEVPMDTSKMTEQELQFHYFKMHDADNNNKLDGCELIKSLIHWHAESKGDQDEAEKIYSDAELTETIDQFLRQVDKNHNGFIEWFEFQEVNH